MLLEFSVQNLLSFKDKVTLNMRAASIKDHEEDNTFIIKKNRYLRSAAIYGANASGKSNLINAMGFMRYFIRNSFRETRSTDEIDVTPFKLNTESEKLPSHFEILFMIGDIRYRYGFEVDRKSVKSEWLYSLNSKRETKLFDRKEKVINVQSSFKEGKKFVDNARDNVLFLSVVDQLNGPISKSIINWFKNFHVISGIETKLYEDITLTEIKKDSNKIIEFLKEADIDIDNLQLEEFEITDKQLPSSMPLEIRKDFWGKKRVKLFSEHKVLDKEGKVVDKTLFDFDEEESEGTKKLFHLAGPIFNTLDNGAVLVIDELDIKLHPFLTRAIVLLFNSKKTNPKNAQLIFATHNTNLLRPNLLRRDQVWFTEKNKFKSTELYSLVEYKLPESRSKVRNDASYEKDYLNGRYGAVPILGDIDRLFEEKE